MSLPACPSGKIAYASAAQAHETIRSMKRQRRHRRGLSGDDLRVYRCTACGAHHLSTTPAVIGRP